MSVAVVPWRTAAAHCPGSLFFVRFAVWITGFSESFTVTVNVLTVLFPTASVAVTVTVVVPSAKREPEAGLLLTVTVPAQLSVAVGVKVTTAPQAPGSLLRLILAGTTSDGFSVS